MGPTGPRSNCGVGVLMDLSGESSHDLVEDGLRLLENLDHRGARGAEEDTGDGAGILLQKPHAFLTSQVPELGSFDSYGVGQVFLPRDGEARARLQDLVEEQARGEGFDVVAWRDVPTDAGDLGETARETEPDVRQFFVEPREDLDPEELDTGLYVLRRVLEGAVEDRDPPGAGRFYVCSLDRRKIVYKGLLTNAQLRTYYPDLADDRVESSLVLVHSRFSTNTLGAWELAHPYRGIIHNGEFNTLRGNLNWMRAREADLASPRFGDDVEKLKPVTDGDQSDTAVVDDVLELLVEAGRSPPHALRMLIPEAWERDDRMDPARRDWYRYHATLNEPWDGPALVIHTDGESVTAVLDRNGLRPCRYHVTDEGRLVMASETGALEIDPSEVVRKDRLRPGEIFHADAERGVVAEEEIFDELADERYGEWVDRELVPLDDVVPPDPPTPSASGDLTARQRAFGYTLEHRRRLVQPMAEDGKDPIGSMGNDTPSSVLSSRNKRLFTYFKQLFAQVSNPPIDYIREELVTSLRGHVGRQNNLLGESPEHARQLLLESPILTREEQAALREVDERGIRSETVDITYPKGERSLEEAVEAVRDRAVEALADGDEVLVLSDRATGPDRVPIPSLLAVGAVHHHLVREGLRTRAGLVVESGQPCAVHDVCTLLGYGADAVTPYLAYETVEDLVGEADLEASRGEALTAYREALESGIQKVMSKMGISTLESYKGAQIFEAVGLDPGFVADHFEGTEARTGGIDVDDLERDLLERHDEAYGTDVPGSLDLDQGGEFYWRRDGELHQWNPNTVALLRRAAWRDDRQAYREFAEAIDEQDERLQTFRGLLDFDTDGRDPVPLEEVEPVEEIFPRFFTASMSFGSLSEEVHETLAIAMNRLGGYASSGEGGEPTDRFGTERECRNKQVASGRFGVTSDYLVHADHLEIKMAQGSKPGEGGHLPGEKVNPVIAETRNTTPGVPLISPPPHHDIYSIEDLAQLIHDLKCSNPAADVHVKLVSEAGVGIIAAGVAKGKADAVLISGGSGGTGASPKSSIKGAAVPWELGISEANQILLGNGLRSRIRVRVDGGMKTGRDVAVAALLGAEEYGFGTAALVTCGCIMLRKCHCNTCSVGIATQDPDLRENFPGEPGHVVAFFHHVARHLREIMAELGVRTVDEMVGRTDLLEQKDVDHPKAQAVDLSALLARPSTGDAPRKTAEQNHGLEGKLDHDLVEEARPALEDRDPVTIRRRVTNRDRTLGAILSSEVSRRHGGEGLPPDTVTLDLVGTGGQSFGAFLAPGVTARLEGDANDYLGKGLSGGKIVVRTPGDAAYAAGENVVVGNVALYGATDGEAYVNGRAGERFAVRNSGAMAVVEGVGDHGCEYMTGGVAVVLGEVGRNFGAGMSGGEAYVLDAADDLEERVNTDMVHLEPLDDERDRQLLRRMVENHHRYTGSDRARHLLEDWEHALGRFVKVTPDAYARVVEERLAEGEDVRPSPPPTPHGETPATPPEVASS